jgi:hypothetical protein
MKRIICAETLAAALLVAIALFFAGCPADLGPILFNGEYLKVEFLYLEV